MHSTGTLKPRPHQQHCRLLQIERFFRQCRTLLRHCCRFRQHCLTKFLFFDKVETNWTCSICFDFVERTKFRSTLLPFVATKSNVASTNSNVASTMLPVASTLLLVWTGPNVSCRPLLRSAFLINSKRRPMSRRLLTTVRVDGLAFSYVKLV